MNLNFLVSKLDLYDVKGELNQNNYDEIMQHLTPKCLAEFIKELGISAESAKSLLIKTLSYVDDYSNDFDT